MMLTKGTWQSCLRLSLVLLFCCAAATAQTPPGTATPPGMTPQQTNPCDKKNKSLKDTASCLKHIYDKVTQKDGFHLVQGGVVPGSGTAVGIGYGWRKPYENWRVELNTSARVSLKKYWEVDGNLRLTKSENKFSSNTASGPVGDLKINLYGLIKDAPRLDYFGLGPESKEEDRAVFHYREGVIGADISKPLTPWLDVGGAVEGIFPTIVTIDNPTVRSVERVYTETTAPGITSQPGFFHAAAFAGLHTPGQPESRKLEYKFFYHVYQDVSDHRYSFRRFDADLKHKFPFADKNEFRFRARFSFADTSGNNRVPFYLMETLGGSNIRGDDTLRGFRDYRFRDRDLVLLQVEYLRQVYGPINLIAFYDTGKVASSLSRLDQGRLRHTYGFGIVVVPRRGDNVLFRFYVALGSGEGAHTFFGVGDALGGRADRLVR
ncbi:MAG: hypothetical protein WCB68_11130 [Pyrinomonadaceae bacterium]